MSIADPEVSISSRVVTAGCHSGLAWSVGHCADIPYSPVAWSCLKAYSDMRYDPMGPGSTESQKTLMFCGRSAPFLGIHMVLRRQMMATTSPVGMSLAGAPRTRPAAKAAGQMWSFPGSQEPRKGQLKKQLP